MSDMDGGAAAPAGSVAAPVDEAVSTPNPVSTEGEAKTEPKVEKSEPDKPVSTREALKRAAEKVEKDNAPDKAQPVKSEPKAVEKAREPEPKKDERPRAEHGHFAPKEPTQSKTDAKPVSDPPARFADDAKAIWKDLPEPARRETERAIRELTQGHEKYKAAAERDEGLREFHEMAEKGGTTVKDALGKYTQMESLLRQDPLRGLNEICNNIGLSLRDVAAHVLGQTPDQNASQQDATIRELRQELATLKDQVGGVTKTFEQQREQSTLSEITKFAEQNPRFEELADDIAFFMKSGRAKDLSQAYSLAERLNPATATVKEDPPAASSAAVIDLPAQTEKGSKSINGAPSPGSSPQNRKASSSIRESVRRAFADAG